MSDPAWPRVRWGILSTGHIASVLTRDLALLPDEAEVAAVGSRRQESADAFAEQHELARAYGSYEELVADPDLDVIYVASVHNDHFASARMCLEGGKAVLVEKPLTVTADQSAELIEFARQRGLFLMEAMWTRTHPLLRKGVELVGSGELGPIRHVTASFGFAFDGDPSHRLLDPDQAGGAVLDLGVYPVHLTNLFLGEPTGVLGAGSRGPTGVDVHAAATLTFEATAQRPAATAHVVCSLVTDLPTRLEVWGERGSLRYDNAILPAELEVSWSDDREPEKFVTQWPGGGYTFQGQEVMRCLRSGACESPMVPWADTMAVARTLDRWQASIPG